MNLKSKHVSYLQTPASEYFQEFQAPKPTWEILGTNRQKGCEKGLKNTEDSFSQYEYCSMRPSYQVKWWSLKWGETVSIKRADVSVAAFHSVELGVVRVFIRIPTVINNRKYPFANSENTFKLYFNRSQKDTLFKKKKKKTEFPRTAQSSLGRCENLSCRYQPRAPLYRCDNTFGYLVSLWWFIQ